MMSGDLGRVLIVDDNEDDQIQLKRLLRGEARVSVAFTGAEALERLEYEAFDLLITDQKMPRMSGDALIRQVKRSESHAALPCILLSGITSDQQLVDILKEGNIYSYFDKNKVFLSKDGKTEFLLAVRNGIRSSQLSNEKNQLTKRLQNQVESLSEQYFLLKKLFAERNPRKIVELITQSLFNRIESFAVLGVIRFPRTNHASLFLKGRGDDEDLFGDFTSFAIEQCQRFTGGSIESFKVDKKLKSSEGAFLNLDEISSIDLAQIPMSTIIIGQELMGVIYILKKDGLNKEEREIFKVWVEQFEDAISRISEDLMSVHDRFDAIMDAIQSGVIITNQHGVVIASNPTAQSILDLNSSIEELDFYRVISKLGISSFTVSRQLSHYSNTPEWIEVQVDDQSYEILIKNLVNAREQFIGILTLIRDVSDKRRTDKQRDEFIHIISHELRNPINNVGIIIDLLRKNIFGDLTKGQSEYLEIAHKSLSKSNEILDDLLDIAKFKEGKIPIFFRDLKIYDLIIYSMRQHSANALSKKIRVEFLSMDKEDLVIRADEKRLSQVMNNLLSNAIKFTNEEGEIRIEIHLSEFDHKTCVISIYNTGEGIKNDDLLKIFDKFEQLDISQQRTVGGTGLGLSICKNIIHGHDGQIWVESKPGEGNLFIFSLPIEETDLSKTLHTYKKGFGEQVILVGAGEADLFVIKSLLLSLEYHVELCPPDFEQIQEALRSRSAQALIYCYEGEALDVELVERLSAYHDLPLLTTSPSRSFVSSDFHLEAPIDPLLLGSSLSALIHRARRRRKQRILLIDEEASWRAGLASRLEERGYLPFMAASFDEAPRRAALLSPDLCLLDKRRPGATERASTLSQARRVLLVGEEELSGSDRRRADDVLFARIKNALRGRPGQDTPRPLLALPGPVEVERELRAQLQAERPVGLCLVGLTGLKAGAAQAGFMWAHHALIHLGDLLHHLLSKRKGVWSFLGHQPGDDLIVLIEARSLAPFCEELEERFERLAPLLSRDLTEVRVALRITALSDQGCVEQRPEALLRRLNALHLEHDGDARVYNVGDGEEAGVLEGEGG